MEDQSKGFDGVKSYPSTVASFKFKVGTVQGNLLLGIYFLAVILFTKTSFKEVDVDVFIASTTHPREEVSERIKYALHMAMQNFDGRKMIISVQNQERVEDVKLINPKVAEN